MVQVVFEIMLYLYVHVYMAILEFGNTNGGTATMGENIEERKRNAIAGAPKKEERHSLR
jgi:hypothetical protein